jgi:hypothetical protein
MIVYLDDFFCAYVASLAEASYAVQAYLDEYCIGASNFVGGQITDDLGTVIGVVSYNGRVWEPRWNECSAAWVGSDREIVFDAEFSSRWDKYKR